MSENKVHGTWSSRWTFIFAATGSAVGLGNIWKFPYITGENGGGAFVFVYLFCIALIGIPIMVGEVLLGRRGRQNPVQSVSSIATEAGRSANWKVIGVLGSIAGLLIMSFYSVIAGWAMHYAVTTLTGSYVGATPDEVGTAFDALLQSPVALSFWHTLFALMTFGVVAAGVTKGLGSVARFMMPFLFFSLFILLIYSFILGDFSAAFSFLFSFDFSALTLDSVLVAMGHAFFTLGVGMGAIMAYGAYMPKGVCLGKAVLTVGFLDTLIALLAGLAIFPIVFATSAIEPSAGPGLLFVSLPVAFGGMPLGAIIGALFFILVTVAAWSSSVSLIEPATAWLIEKKKFSRVKASGLVMFVAWALGFLTVFSFNEWSDFKPIWLLSLTPFDFLDFLTSQIMLPLGGLLIAIFVAWKLPLPVVQSETTTFSQSMRHIWLVILKFVSPVLVIAVMIAKLYETLLPLF